MGLFRGLVGKSLDIAPSESGVEPSDSWLTPANALTAARPLLAAQAARMLLRGERPVWPVVAAMAASDAEGSLARLIDRFFPESGLGTSTKGAQADPIADTLALTIVSGAAMRAPRVPLLGKGAIALVGGQEAAKAAWAITRGMEYYAATGEILDIPPTKLGKEAMAEKLTAVGFAILASDLDGPAARVGLSAGAMAMATIGTLRAGQEQGIYNALANERIANASVSDVSRHK